MTSDLVARDRIAALQQVRDEVLDFSRCLTDDEWRTPSAAEGWTVQDVVAHLGGSFHLLLGVKALSLMKSSNIERSNDAVVEQRRDRSPQAVLAEYEKWSRRAIGVTRAIVATPAAKLPLPLAELGKFPAGVILTGAFVFDHHTHLRFDIAPALGRELHEPKEGVLAVAIDWMLAVLRNQIRQGAVTGLDQPLTLVLSGAGGGEWSVTADGVTPGRAPGAIATIEGKADGFPDWGTKRSPWAEHSVEVTGDREAAGRFLDQLNII